MKIISEVSANVIKCDVKDCPSRFFSYSDHPFIRKQAKIEHWGRRSARRVVHDVRIADLCPEHNAFVLAHAKEARDEVRRQKLEAKRAEAASKTPKRQRKPKP